MNLLVTGAMGFFDKFNRVVLGTPLVVLPELMATIKEIKEQN